MIFTSERIAKGIILKTRFGGSVILFFSQNSQDLGIFFYKSQLNS